MKILHLIKRVNDLYAQAAIQAQQGENQTSCVLIQDATLSVPELNVPVFALKEDVQARGGSPNVPLIDFDQLVDMLFEHDAVVCW